MSWEFWVNPFIAATKDHHHLLQGLLNVDYLQTMKLRMFHKLETAEEPCGAGMLEWTEIRPSQSMPPWRHQSENDKWISCDKSHTFKCCLFISAEKALWKDYWVVHGSLQNSPCWTGCQVSLILSFLRSLTLKSFMLIRPHSNSLICCEVFQPE